MSELHDLLSAYEARFLAEETESAVGFIVDLYDAETQGHTFYGPFSSPIEAIAWGDAAVSDFARLDPDASPITASVHNLLDPH
jgi:hypothetical protein